MLHFKENIPAIIVNDLYQKQNGQHNGMERDIDYSEATIQTVAAFLDGKVNTKRGAFNPPKGIKLTLTIEPTGSKVIIIAADHGNTKQEVFFYQQANSV